MLSYFDLKNPGDGWLAALWESRLPEELLRLPEELARLPEELARVDALLDDSAFFTPFAPHFHPALVGRRRWSSTACG